MISQWKRLPAVGIAALALLAGCGSGGTPVTYEVFGTGSADVTYYDGSKDVTVQVTLPWRKDIHIDKDKFTVKVQATGDGGLTACAASVKDERIVQATPINPAFNSVLCAKEYPGS
jgi:hypothetical protein